MTHAHASPLAAGEDPGRARERLLDVAERLFAERGYRAPSVRTSTAEARCNIAAVNYYFGGKENLYQAMYRRLLVALREQRIASLRRAMDGAGDGAGIDVPLRAFTTAFLEPHLDQSGGRRMMRLFSQEMLEPRLRPGTFQREMIEPLVRALTAALRAARPRLRPRAARLCVLSLVAQLAHLVQMRSLPGPARGPERPESSLPTIVDHIVKFTAAGIEACVS